MMRLLPALGPVFRARVAAHAAFDQLWKPYPEGERFRRRARAYIWLRRQMDLKEHECHIALFNEAQCQKVVELVLHVPPWPALPIPNEQAVTYTQEGREHA